MHTVIGEAGAFDDQHIDLPDIFLQHRDNTFSPKPVGPKVPGMKNFHTVPLDQKHVGIIGAVVNQKRSDRKVFYTYLFFSPKGSDSIISRNVSTVDTPLIRKMNLFGGLTHIEGNVGHDQGYHADMIAMIMRKEYAIAVVSRLGNTINR